jgi:hypothetical protein
MARFLLRSIPVFVFLAVATGCGHSGGGGGMGSNTAVAATLAGSTGGSTGSSTPGSSSGAQSASHTSASAAPPTIYQATPDEGIPQDVIDIRGHGFDPDIKNDVVKFGSAVATIQWEMSNPDHDTLRVNLPPVGCGCAGSGTLLPGVVMITVTVDGKVSNSIPFTVR